MAMMVNRFNMDYNSDKKRCVWYDLNESYVWQDEYNMNYMIERWMWYEWVTCLRRRIWYVAHDWEDENEHDMHCMIKRNVYMIWCMKLTIRWKMVVIAWKK